jgi:catechol 2,3-dioxygenase-like lactoylglutathione lyase family enzyme
LDHFAFAVKDYAGTRDRLAAAGVKIAREVAGPPREFVGMFPDGIKVEFYEDATLATPIAHHHLHFRTTDPDAERAWWVKAFGADVKQEGTRTITTIPGATLSFTKVDVTAPKTQGRTLDHTGVNVKNVTEYCTKLAGLGITCERPSGLNTPIAMVTDPAGVRIEINQGLESR